MKKFEFTLPAGYGGNMDYSGVELKNYPLGDTGISIDVKSADAAITFDVVLDTSVNPKFENMTPNILDAMMILDASKALDNRGVYYK